MTLIGEKIKNYESKTLYISLYTKILKLWSIYFIGNILVNLIHNAILILSKLKYLIFF